MSGCCAAVALSWKMASTKRSDNCTPARLCTPRSSRLHGFCHRSRTDCVSPSYPTGSAIEVAGIGVDLILHATDTFGGFFKVGCTVQNLCITRAIPSSEHLGITDNSSQIGAAKAVTGLCCSLHIWQFTILSQEFKGSSIFFDVFFEDFPLLPGLRQLRLQPQLNAATSK